ncbi:hypothetical protein [Streptomyces sp. KL116D]|uniref:hypothetical protein n=1 Tax=Streptomyces sp. KL116D TaxID=3045152 RepID=UPI00355772E3
MARTTWTPLADLMQRRTPTADVTAQQLRDRSWWRGPTVYVIIDDYDPGVDVERQPAGGADRTAAVRP